MENPSKETLETTAKEITSSVKILLEQTKLTSKQINKNEVVSATNSLRSCFLTLTSLTNEAKEEVECIDAIRALMANSLKIISSKTKGLSPTEKEENALANTVDTFKINFGTYVRYARGVLEKQKKANHPVTDVRTTTFSTSQTTVTLVSYSDPHTYTTIPGPSPSPIYTEEVALRRRSAPRLSSAISHDPPVRKPPPPNEPDAGVVVTPYVPPPAVTPGSGEFQENAPILRKKNPRLIQNDRRASDSLLAHKTTSRNMDGTKVTTVTLPMEKSDGSSAGRTVITTARVPSSTVTTTTNTEPPLTPTGKTMHRKSERPSSRSAAKVVPKGPRSATLTAPVNPRLLRGEVAASGSAPVKQLSQKAEQEMNDILAMLLGET